MREQKMKKEEEEWKEREKKEIREKTMVIMSNRYRK